MQFHTRLAGILMAGAAFLAPAPANAGYYDGKTVKVIIGLAPGGTVDTLTRAFTTVWEKHIDGKPQFIVENMPGGGGTRALNYVFKAKPDGLTILFGPWGPITEVLGEEMLQAKHGKYEYIGGLTDIRVNYVRTDIVPGGMKKASDIMKATSLKVGGNNATGISDLMARMAFETLGVHEVLGAKYGYVTGFSGGSEIYAALKRNEVQAHNTSISSFRQRSGSGVDAGEFMGVAYSVYVNPNGSYTNNKEITEMPSFPDLYKEVHGKMPSGPRWDAFNWFTGLVGDMAYVSFAPPGTPKNIVEELRAAFTKGCADKEFVGPLIKKFGIGHDCVSLQEGARIIKSIDSVDPKILATFKQVIKEGEK